MNKTELMLKEMKRVGGMTFVDCQRFMVELKYGKGSYDPRKHRGHYSGTLCGCKSYDGWKRPKDAGPGSVLEKWCVLGRDGKYRIRRGLKLKPPYHPMQWPGERYERMVQAKCKHRFEPYSNTIAQRFCSKCSKWE